MIRVSIRCVMRAMYVSWAVMGILAVVVAPHAHAKPQFHLVWQSGFENGFPGEWHPYRTDAWSPGGTMPADRVSAWTIASRAAGHPVYSGEHSYRGWISGRAPVNHRAYPVIHASDPANIVAPVTNPLVSSFMVWLDCDWSGMSSGEWIHLASWANNTQWRVHTMSVRNRRLEFAHTEPFGGEYIGPLPVPDFPLRRWVRMTVYIEYNGDNGFVQAWQDGVAMLRAKITIPGNALLRAHWGMYAHPDVANAVQYNDDIRIWTLSAPLAELVTEPLP